MKKLAYVIAPHAWSKSDSLKEYIADLEKDNWVVFYPSRDDDAKHLTEYFMAQNHEHEIKLADRVFVFWDGESNGCVFDLGIAFALHKEIELVNIPEVTPYRSIQNILNEWEHKSLVIRGVINENSL